MIPAALLLAALAQAGAPAPAPAPAPAAVSSAVPAPVATGEAIAFFRQFCVDTLPLPSAFAERLDLPSRVWTSYEKPGRDPAVRGNFWRSPRGELAYLYRPGADGSGPNPVCEYAFLTAPDFSREAAAGALASALGLGAGQNADGITRWETRLSNGTEARLTLSADGGMGGPAARLSIFAYRLPPNFE